MTKILLPQTFTRRPGDFLPDGSWRSGERPQNGLSAAGVTGEIEDGQIVSVSPLVGEDFGPANPTQVYLNYLTGKSLGEDGFDSPEIGTYINKAANAANSPVSEAAGMPAGIGVELLAGGRRGGTRISVGRRVMD